MLPPKHMLLVALAWFACSVGMARVSAAEPPKPFEEELRPLLDTYCYKCHNDEKKEGELNLQRVRDHRRAVDRPELWERVTKRLVAKDMPPEDEPQPSDAERARIMAWVKSLPKNENCEQLATDKVNFYRGYVMSRRLNRSEYNNTLRDLLGVDLRPADQFPADGAGGEGFDTSGDALFSSAILMEKYLSAAEQVLTKILPTDESATQSPELQAARNRLLLAEPSEQIPPRTAADKIVRSFARRAFRRPVTDEEVERLLTLFDRAQQRGDTFAASVRLSLQGVLISPNFLFLVEPEPAEEGVYRLEGYPLASRLSYFLWSSCPDEELLALAEGDKLHDPDLLRQQVQRMLKDPRAQALGENFCVQWLNIGGLGGTVKPDAGKFPEFDADLSAAMRSESVLFFQSIFQEDRPLLDLLHADYTFLNERLAKHYGIANVSGTDMRRVTLTDGNRGGVVTQASVLTVSSYPLRTSPVLRGRFVVEEILGGRVPPPPPNIPTLSAGETNEEGLTLREQLEQHRAKAECASCHNRMDPLGFGLENFDPIGRWRNELSGAPIDSAGKLPSGEAFRGPQELKQLLVKRQGEVLRHLTRKMLGYALGRELNKFDQCVVDDALKALAQNEFRASVLVEQIVLSYPFQHRYVKK